MSCRIIHVGHDVCPPTHTFARPGGFPHWMAGYQVKGNIGIEAEGRRSITMQGDFSIMPPNVSYRLWFAGGEMPWTGYYIAFIPPEGWDDLLALPPPAEGRRGVSLRGLACEGPVLDTYREARAWQERGTPDWAHFATNALERILLLVRDACRERAAGQRDERIEALRSFLPGHLDEPHSVQSLAARAHLSPPRFAALFRASTGASPMHYLMRLRIRRAQELLIGTSQPVGEIARELGFANQHHFAVRFRRITGQSPREYRLSPRAAPVLPA